MRTKNPFFVSLPWYLCPPVGHVLFQNSCCAWYGVLGKSVFHCACPSHGWDQRAWAGSRREQRAAAGVIKSVKESPGVLIKARADRALYFTAGFFNTRILQLIIFSISAALRRGAGRGNVFPAPLFSPLLVSGSVLCFSRAKQGL